MLLGSHNTMSYMKPQWWMRPFAFMARCQSEKLIDQWYDRKVRMFDLRIVFEDSIPYFAHGLATYKAEGGASPVHYTLQWLNTRAWTTGEKVIVRVINERNKDEDTFAAFCAHINETYTNLQFCGFRNKNSKGKFNPWTDRETGQLVLGDTNKNIQFIDKYSSDNCDKHEHCTGTWLDDWCPWIYARLFNRRWRKEYKDYDGVLLQDFVGQY